MANVILLLAIFSALLPTTTQDIEKAFLQNNAKMLYKLFSSRNYINISFPEPIYFSDNLSNQQAYFFFQKIFSSYSTFEFYSESELPVIPENQSFIFKARWSFKNKKDKNQYVFHIFFYIMNERYQKARASPRLSDKKNKKINNDWKITEIKAEKI